MRADGGEAVEVRKPPPGNQSQPKACKLGEVLTPGGAAMVSEAVRRSASWSGCGVDGEGGVPWPEGSSAASSSWEPIAANRRSQACGPMAVKPCAKREGWPGHEEDGRHGLRGCSEVGELVRMRSRLHASAADQAEPEACGPMAVKPLRCASARGRPRAQVKRTAAMVSEAVRR